jgi:hypothetical protein
MNCQLFTLLGLKFDSNYLANLLKLLHRATNYDQSGDEYRMTNIIFELTSGSAGTKHLFP